MSEQIKFRAAAGVRVGDELANLMGNGRLVTQVTLDWDTGDVTIVLDDEGKVVLDEYSSVEVLVRTPVDRTLCRRCGNGAKRALIVAVTWGSGTVTELVRCNICAARLTELVGYNFSAIEIKEEV